MIQIDHQHAGEQQDADKGHQGAADKQFLFGSVIAKSVAL